MEFPDGENVTVAARGSGETAGTAFRPDGGGGPFPSRWADLFDMAVEIINRAEAAGVLMDDWTFGGGTALMLHMDHRESHDVDFFVSDPQYLPFLNPITQEYELPIPPSNYGLDGNSSLKIHFQDLGEIDFICCGHVSDDPYRIKGIRGRDVRVETIGEVICKKIWYRGKRLRPRDMFDIAVARAHLGDERLVESLLPAAELCRDAVAVASRANRDYVAEEMRKLLVNPKFEDLREDARDTAIDILTAVGSAAEPERGDVAQNPGP